MKTFEIMDIVSFEAAKKLKEKGFNAEFKYSLGYYDTLGNFMSTADHWFLDSWIIAPTISQVLKWLREEKKIHIQVVVWEKGWYCEVWEFGDDSPIFKSQSEDFKTYEQAALAGVQWVIDDLI